jgi:hypothetical protein
MRSNMMGVYAEGISWGSAERERLIRSLVLYCERSGTGLKACMRLWMPACLPALTVNSGMRYRIVFRLSCGCPPDGILSPQTTSASPAGICKAVLLTVLPRTNVQKLPDQSLGSSIPGEKLLGCVAVPAAVFQTE